MHLKKCARMLLMGEMKLKKYATIITKYATLFNYSAMRFERFQFF